MSSECAAVTIGGAIASAATTLRASGIASPRLDAELLLGHILGKTRTQLAIDADAPVLPTAMAAFELLVERRLTGEPIAYLVGHREFMGHDFLVGPGVLVPRPETELLVDRALEMLDRIWPGQPVRVFDLCTGSGAIALSLALATDPARVRITASDISAQALAYAQANRAKLDLDDRVVLVRGDLLRWTRGPWDLILANPPYLRPDQIDGNQEIRTEPRLALDGGLDGIELIARMLEQASPIVQDTFGMLVELDPDHAAMVQALAIERFPGARVAIIPDLSGRDRIVSIER